MNPNPRAPILRVFAFARHPSTWIAVICVTVGTLLVAGGGPDQQLSDTLRLFLTPRYLGYALLGIGFVAYAYATARSVRIKTFSEIDERVSREKDQDSSLGAITAELRQLSNVDRIDYAKIEEIIKSQVSASQSAAQASDYRGHFLALSKVLEEKARLSDEKASVLLDKGTFYVWVGIVFYLTSIALWQVIIAQATFRPEFIYGMVSCTFLFLFIEFLSAWFLKQYRHFVDTSTYLLKVKAIFDRYQLLFLAVAGQKKDLSDDDAKAKLISRALMDDIPWPNDAHLSKADVTFAREALVSLSSLVRATRTNKRNEEEEG
jgi:hypothetical protein